MVTNRASYKFVSSFIYHDRPSVRIIVFMEDRMHHTETEASFLAIFHLPKTMEFTSPALRE